MQEISSVRTRNVLAWRDEEEGAEESKLADPRERPTNLLQGSYKEGEPVSQMLIHFEKAVNSLDPGESRLQNP